VIQFLAGSPTSDEIIHFKVSPETQTRLGELLEKNREESLNEFEEMELDAYEQIEHFMILLKAQAAAMQS
jgi:hypothetical protein